MVVDEGSQSLFDDTCDKEINSTETGDKDLNNSKIETASQRKHLGNGTQNRTHWLFQKDKDYVPINHPREDTTKRHHVSIKQLYDDVALCEKKIREAQLMSEPLEWTTMVKADKSVSIDDDIVSLFRSDTMRFKKTVVLNMLQQNDFKPVQDDAFDVESDNLGSSFFQSRFPRKAKNKLRVTEQSSDDEFASVPKKTYKLPAFKLTKMKPRKTILLDEIPTADIKNVLHNKDKDLDCIIELQPMKKRKLNDEQSNILNKVSKLVTGTLSGLMKKSSKIKTDQVAATAIDDDTDDVLEKEVEVVEEEEEKEANSVIKKNETVQCPMCNKCFPLKEINDHAYQCQGPTSVVMTRNRSQHASNSVIVDGSSAFNSYDVGAWQSACKGLNQSGVSHQNSQDVIGQEDIKNTFGGKPKTKRNTKKQTVKTKSDWLSDDEEEPIPAALKEKTFKHNGYSTVRNNVNRNGTRKHIQNNNDNNGFISDDDSDDNICNGYLTTASTNKTSIKNETGFRRTFGNNSQDEHDDFMKCYKCGGMFAQDQFKTHTDTCMDQSSFMEP